MKTVIIFIFSSFILLASCGGSKNGYYNKKKKKNDCNCPSFGYYDTPKENTYVCIEKGIFLS